MNLISIDQSLRATGITIWTSKDGYIYHLIGTEKTKGTKCPTIDYTRRIIDLKNLFLYLFLLIRVFFLHNLLFRLS